MHISKLAVFDLDRTLLNDDSVISSQSEARIHAAMVPGLACTIASGRDMAHIMPYIDQLGWKSVPVVRSKGGSLLHLAPASA